MTARDDILNDTPETAESYLLSVFTYLQRKGDWKLTSDLATVRCALDLHAHELAEQIRAEFISDRRGRGMVSAWQVAQEAAALIDPEVP